MSNASTVVKMFVEAKSPFGILNADTKKWMNPLKKDMLKLFQIGKGYEVTVEKAKGDDGKVRDYITSVKPLQENQINDSPKVENKAPSVAAPAKEAVNKAAGLSVGEKDSRILVQGLTQAFLQSPLVNMIPDGVVPLDFVEQNVKQLVQIVKRLSETK